MSASNGRGSGQHWPAPPPAGDRRTRLLYVPVHPCACAPGAVTIQAGHLPSGQAVGLGFTSPDRLAMVFGPRHPWIRLHLSTLHEMLEPLGITLVRIDPLRSPGTTRPCAGPVGAAAPAGAGARPCLSIREKRLLHPADSVPGTAAI